jgi:GT2 family glycosyltransferase
MDSRPLFSFILVNFRSAGALAECLDSLEKIGPPPETREIIVVNNDADEADVLESLKRRYGFSLIQSSENLGFGKASNLGARTAQGWFFVFLNPDSSWSEGDLLEAGKYLEADPSRGILGFRLTGPGGGLQPWSAGTEVTLWDIVRNNLGLAKSKTLWKSSVPVDADWVSGAALMIRRTLFERLAGFDEDFFLYFEDVDLCRRARLLGRKAIYFPYISIVHLGGKSSPSATRQKRCFYDSQDLYFRKHRPKWEGTVLQWLRRITHFKKYQEVRTLADDAS